MEKLFCPYPVLFRTFYSSKVSNLLFPVNVNIALSFLPDLRNSVSKNKHNMSIVNDRTHKGLSTLIFDIKTFF